MVATSDTIDERIEAAHRERTARLATRATHYEIEAEAGGWIVRNPKVPGRIELVSNAGVCSCERFAVWGRCKHAALVEVQEAQDTSWHILKGGKA